MGIEFELKFRATPEILEKLRQAVPGQQTVFRMETTYYDTRDGALAARKYTLRRRMENDVSVCTLKAPVEDCHLERSRVSGGAERSVIPKWEADFSLRLRLGRNDTEEKTAQGRGEYELNSDCIEDAIPELCKLSGIRELTALTASGVVPICGARFTRVAIHVELDDCAVELALDEGVLSGGGREVPLCEVEVELKSGSREGAVAYALALGTTYGLKRERDSKFRRALALAKGE